MNFELKGLEIKSVFIHSFTMHFLPIMCQALHQVLVRDPREENIKIMRELCPPELRSPHSIEEGRHQRRVL